MNRTEAKAILNQHLDDLQSLGHAALECRVGENQAFVVRGESGVDYQIEMTILWDREPFGPLRIIGSIDDGGLSSFLPLTLSRLVEPKLGE